jgi:hypothetical protein
VGLRIRCSFSSPRSIYGPDTDQCAAGHGMGLGLGQGGAVTSRRLRLRGRAKGPALRGARGGAREGSMSVIAIFRQPSECTGTSALWTGHIRYSPLRWLGLGIRENSAVVLAPTYAARHRGRGNVVIPKGFPRSVGRVGSRLYCFPCFPHSVISMACFRGADQKSTFLKSPSSGTTTPRSERRSARLISSCRRTVRDS